MGLFLVFVLLSFCLFVFLSFCLFVVVFCGFVFFCFCNLYYHFMSFFIFVLTSLWSNVSVGSSLKIHCLCPNSKVAVTQWVTTSPGQLKIYIGIFVLLKLVIRIFRYLFVSKNYEYHTLFQTWFADSQVLLPSNCTFDRIRNIFDKILFQPTFNRDIYNGLWGMRLEFQNFETCDKIKE